MEAISLLKQQRGEFEEAKQQHEPLVVEVHRQQKVSNGRDYSV